MHKAKLIADPLERRARRRFRIEQDLLYTCLSGSNQTGVGKVLNISSKGVCFTTQSAVKRGTRIELAMNWPAMLDPSCGMKLMLYGSVVRSEANSAAARIEHYEFRTRALRPVPMPPTSRADTGSSR
ncbi:MAG TPA: PilZ domain-containing protein [Bryobacteraceae bacterium]|nr:PilZ domain-containing protein [Bryobacteraceae bacterium]